MNEKGSKRREWIKTAAIIFLAVMLVLTFFSNTIMNYSLPEVATQYVMSDSITARIRGTGTIESGDPYHIEVKESRKVASVAVRVGDMVQKGDVLLYLEDVESQELKDAQDKLKDAQNDLQAARDTYNAALLSDKITAQDIQAANSNTSDATYRQQITNIQAEITAAKAALAPLEEKVASLDREILNIDTELKYQESRLTAAEAKLEGLQSVSGNDSDAQQSDVTAAQAECDSISKTISSLKAARATSVYNKYLAERDRDAAEAVKKAAENKLDDLMTLLDHKKILDGLKEDISDAQKVVNEAQALVDKLEAEAVDVTVTADISGTVTSVNVVAGNTTTPGFPVVVLQPEGQGYTMSFSVTNEQARRLAVGDRADLVNAWRYDDVTVTLASKKADTNNPNQNTKLTFNVTGNVVAGQTLSISVGQQSSNYDLVVPNSAIREDSNGKFILIVESRSTPLGNRYIASRVDVEVIASDETRSAISGALYGYEYVITTSTKPVDAGQQVRLADN
ncbi:MAG: biotin/lipoyl-binding protein [Acetatifactor sp.]|nr:biotin/lipoyl-binding protein [Acetatifactor sp.]